MSEFPPRQIILVLSGYSKNSLWSVVNMIFLFIHFVCLITSPATNAAPGLSPRWIRVLEAFHPLRQLCYFHELDLFLAGVVWEHENF